MRLVQQQPDPFGKISLSRPLHILMADDDSEDVMLIREALEETIYDYDFSSVSDGEELMKFLQDARSDSQKGKGRLPDLILLDLNMPRKGGHETLREIKADEYLKLIPIIILSTSEDMDDVHKAYSAGASSFICKPSEFTTLVEVMSTMTKYWLEVVKLP